MSIAQSILNIVQDEIARHGALRVIKVNLRVGEMTGIVPESLTFCWGLVSEGGPAEGSTLEIERVPLKARCRDCDSEFPVKGAVFECLGCGSSEIEITQGREMTLTSIEAE